MPYQWGLIRGYKDGKAITRYRLIGPETHMTFDTYEELYAYCMENEIDAKVI